MRAAASLRLSNAMAAQTEYYDEEEERRPARRRRTSAARRSLDRPRRFDRRPRPAGRDRDHDVSRGADARRRGAGAVGGGRMAVGGRARDHHPGAAVRADIEADVQKAVTLAPRDARVATAGAYSKENGPAAGALARQRPRARRAAGAAPDRGADRARRAAGSCVLRKRSPRKSPARASTIIAAGSTACARWRAAPWWWA